jgi:hypothetical protein
MNRATDLRLRKLEAPHSGTRFIMSAFPLSDDSVAANVEIDALLTSDEAKFCGCALLPTRELTAKEWATEVSL